MATRPTKNVTPPEDEDEGPPGNDDDVIAIETARRQEQRGLTAVPQRHLILEENDRKTVYGLIVAQLGGQGLEVTVADFDYFIRVCELRGVNPLFREAHLIKDRDGRITVQIGIDGFRKLAEDTGEYRGQTEARWSEELYEGNVGPWQGKPAHVEVGVFREGWEAPLYGESWLDEDGQVGPNGPIGQWAKRPHTMMRKVAEARALRTAFPRQLSGLYSDDEVPTPIPVGEGTGTTVPQRAGATETAGTVATGGWSPPEPPPAPEGKQGLVEAAPDGIRHVKPNSQISAKYGYDGSVAADKLEVVIKSSGRKFTAFLFNELANAVDALALQAAEVVIVVGGKVEEHKWAEDKPTQKQLWAATDVLVLRDNAWVSATAGAPTLPLEEPEVPTAPSSTPTPTTSEGDSPKAATPSQAEDSSASDDEVPDLTPPESIKPKITEELPPLDKTNESTESGLPLVVLELQFKSSAGKAIGVVKSRYGEEVIFCALGDEPEGELEHWLGTAEAPKLKPGDRFAAVGWWREGWLILSGIGRPE